MTAVRLLSAEKLDEWRAILAGGVRAAGTEQRRTVSGVLRSHGLSWDDKVGVAVDVWSEDAWGDAVTRHVTPAARRVADDILSTLRGRVTARTAWGSLPDRDDLVSLVVTRAVGGGPYIASRLSLTAAGGNIGAIKRAAEDAAKGINPEAGAYGGIIHPEAARSLADEMAIRMSALEDLAGNVAGPMGNYAIANLAQAQADALGVSYVWNCAMLPTSRDDHVAADGQSQAAGTPFDVGGEDLMFPGDPNGSDENTINCLCWLEVEGLDLTSDDDG